MKSQDWLQKQLSLLQHLYSQGSVRDDEARSFIQNFTAGYVSEVPISAEGNYQLTYGELIDRIVENKLVGIWVIDSHGQTVYSNETALRILGITAEEAAAAPYHRYIFRPNDFSVRFHPVVKTESEVVELSYKNTEGTEKHLLMSESPLFSAGGVYNGCICLLSEITERKKAEHALHEISSRYRLISEMISDYVYSLRVDNNGKFICDWISGAFQKITGYQLDELYHLEQGYLSIIHEDFRDDFITAYHSGRLTGSIKEYKIVAKNGDERWIQDTASIVIENGRTKLLGAALDITERKETEEILQEEREFNALVFDTIPVGVLVFNKEKKVYYSNAQIEAILKKSKQEIKSLPHLAVEKWGLFPMEETTQEPATNPLEYVFSTRKEIKSCRFSIESDGTTTYLSVNASPIWKNNDFKGIVATFEDITKEIVAENETIKAMKSAEENDRLKSAFLANISHEIRTPLNGIVGFSDMLQQPHITIDQKSKYISVISKSSRQLIQIVNDIIDIAKIQSNQFTLKENEYSVNHIMADIESYFQNEIEIFEKDIDFSVETPLSNDQALISVDGKKLEQVFTKLLSNALKFTEKGAIKIGYVRDGAVLRFYVSDSGIGISEDKKEIIFSNFRQADERQTRNYRGNGLGLSIAKGIVSLMGGSIWFDSEIGRGTTFFFTIPYRPTKQEFLAPVADGDGTLSGKKILIVDDDEFNLEFMREILSGSEATILEALDGKSAVEQSLENKDLNLILMDIRLPDISGTKATSLIKNFLKDVPVIAQTANALAEDRMACYDAGCCDFITKPYTKTSLLRVITRHII